VAEKAHFPLTDAAGNGNSVFLAPSSHGEDCRAAKYSAGYGKKTDT
jgi:hypothetical protein